MSVLIPVSYSYLLFSLTDLNTAVIFSRIFKTKNIFGIFGTYSKRVLVKKKPTRNEG